MDEWFSLIILNIAMFARSFKQRFCHADIAPDSRRHNLIVTAPQLRELRRVDSRLKTGHITVQPTERTL